MNESGIYVILSVGSNHGDKSLNVVNACDWLSGIISEFRMSSIYSSPAYGGGEEDYYNAVTEGTFIGKIEDLEKLCKNYETDHGRNHEARLRGEVPIDIDIVIADGKILRQRDFEREFFQRGYRQLQK